MELVIGLDGLHWCCRSWRHFFATTTSADDLRSGISNAASKLAIIAAASAVANFMSQFFLNWASERIGMKLREAYFNKLTSQEIGFFDLKHVGALTVALSEDATRVQEIYSVKVATVFQSITQFIVGVTLALVACWQMALVMFSTLPLLVILIIGLSRVVGMLTSRINTANDHSASLANEVMSAMRTVRSMAGEEKERGRHKKDLNKMFLSGVAKSIMLGFTVL